jgi:hypothetical protein
MTLGAGRQLGYRAGLLRFLQGVLQHSPETAPHPSCPVVPPMTLRRFADCYL